jgi:integrase
VTNLQGMLYIRLDTATQKGGAPGWKRLSPLSGVPISMYAMRHYFAEQTLGAGVPIHVVSRWMGHSKLELTVKRYGHFAPENADQWAWAARREAVRAVGPVKADLAG